MDAWGATVCDAPFNALAAAVNRVSLINVDLPEPETPVTHVISPAGMSMSTFRKLLPVAPRR